MLSEEPRFRGTPKGASSAERSLYTLVPSLEFAEREQIVRDGDHAEAELVLEAPHQRVELLLGRQVEAGLKQRAALSLTWKV